MSSRYNNRKKLTNTKRFYQEYMNERGIKKIRQYSTPKMKYPKPEAIANEIQRITHIWKSKDMYWKLAAKHYGDSHLWWVIAWFNKKPTESHCKLGDIIHIPMPLETVLYHLHAG
jgi:nucleoid-associated protein YgaU